MDLKDIPLEERLQLARDPETDCLLLERLGCDVEVAVRTAVAGNPSTTLDTLLTLADESEIDIVHALIHREEELDILLSRLVATPDVNALALLASHVRSVTAQSELMRHDDEEVVHSLLHNPHLTDETVRGLYKLCEDSIADGNLPLQILTHLGAHNVTPEHILRELSTFPMEVVRSAVAANPSTPLDVLEVLADDDSTMVRFIAWGNPFTPHYASAFEKYGVDISYARLIRGASAEYWGTLTYFMEDIPDEYWD